jgi:indole-3-glycerol phosphate synthase
MSGDFLAGMAASSRARVAAARRELTDAQLEARVAALATPPPRLVLSREGFDVIAEVKLRSPAVGSLAQDDSGVTARVVDYARAGAVAVSVLTEPERFDGSLQHLRLAAQALAAAGVVPAMRKDFLVDPYQVLEARLAGAGGVLVILRMLTRAELQALIAAAARLSLFVLLEAFDEADIALGAELIAAAPAAAQLLLLGVNSRDLVTLKVVPGRLEQLAPRLPRGVPRVAESGVADAADAARLAAAGYELALIGSALMTAPDPARLLGDMLAAGRAAVRP